MQGIRMEKHAKQFESPALEVTAVKNKSQKKNVPQQQINGKNMPQMWIQPFIWKISGIRENML